MIHMLATLEQKVRVHILQMDIQTATVLAVVPLEVLLIVQMVIVVQVHSWVTDGVMVLVNHLELT